ncbi:DUF4845 domain-containing protein [Thiohalorhabdus methylotrophus]|uniref:DUF4845 domain-containing protein n=1 Tax=Thiohalorhabdus methylotrophus TaxID=3242694 RepID=A0ABV4TWM2_9GAMM
MGADRHSQRGLGLWGILFWLALIGILFWLGARIVPLYYEYWNIQTVFQEQIQKGSLYGTPQELRQEVLKELRFQDLQRLDAKEIQVKKVASGDRYRVWAEYRARVPLARGVELVFTFKPEATEGG